MVKLGFIGEGDTEKAVLESELFRNLLSILELDFVPEVINAEGGGNLIPGKLPALAQILQDKGATDIIILTDKEDAICLTSVKQRISPENKYTIIIAIKMIEAWFLADTPAMSKLMGQNYFCANPEEIGHFDFIKAELNRTKGRGVGNKKMLIRRMLQKQFSIVRAAQHPNCSSATYFVEKLKALAERPK